MKFALVLASAELVTTCSRPDGVTDTREVAPPPVGSHDEGPAKEPRGGAHGQAQPRDAVPEGAVELEFGPLLGGRRPSRMPNAGRYAVGLHARQHRFLTMERTMSRSIDGGAFLDLLDDGSAAGCVWAKTRDESSTSKYASRDGKHHRTDRGHESRLGMHGTWQRVESRRAVTVTLDRFDYRNCVLGPEAREPAEPLVMSCFSLAGGDGLPVGALACRLDTSLAQAETVAMLLADTPRSGSWDLREDMTHRSELQLPEHTRPWLLLGEDPGLRIRHEDGRQRDPLKVELRAGSVAPPVGETPPP